MARLPALTARAVPSSRTYCSGNPPVIFVAFDLLYLNGKDLRTLPLIERKRQLRKRQLRKLLRRKRSRILYLDHVENDGRLLFEQICKLELEGMVCKRKSSPYRVTEKPSPYWIKVKNPRYSQLEGARSCSRGHDRRRAIYCFDRRSVL
jgi:ATP-dependent DNA ligase